MSLDNGKSAYLIDSSVRARTTLHCVKNEQLSKSRLIGFCHINVATWLALLHAIIQEFLYERVLSPKCSHSDSGSNSRCVVLLFSGYCDGQIDSEWDCPPVIGSGTLERRCS